MTIPESPYQRPLLVVDVRQHAPGAFVVELAGEIDTDTCQEIQREVLALLRQDWVERIVLDMGEVTFLDSAGIRTLIICQRDAEQLGARLEIRRAHRTVRRVLAISGVADLFDLPPMATDSP